MQNRNFILKIIALSLVIVSAACLIVAYSDKIVEVFNKITEAAKEKKALAGKQEVYSDPEFEDFADV